MDKTVLGLGLACVVAAIVGGGLEALGVKIPVLSSPKRQLALGVLGLVLIIVVVRYPVGHAVLGKSSGHRYGPISLGPVKSRTFPFRQRFGGRVEVSLNSVSPSVSSLQATICSSEDAGDRIKCPSRQIAPFETLSATLPPGPGEVSISNPQELHVAFFVTISFVE